MRTTISIDYELLIALKKFAVEEGCSVSSITSDAIRKFLFAEGTEKVESAPFSMPVFGDRLTPINSQPSDFAALVE